MNPFKFLKNISIRLIRNYKCLSEQKKIVSVFSAFLSLYTFEIDYLDPYICSVASSMLASIGIYGTYNSLMKILKQVKRKPLNRIPKEPGYIFRSLPSDKMKIFLQTMKDEKNKI